MMFFTDLLFAIVIALLLSWLFGANFRGRNNNDFLFFFLLIMIFTWAGGVWITPIGPLLWGVPWLSFLFVGLFFTLLIIAITPSNRHRKNRTQKKTSNENEAIFIVDTIFWVLIIGVGLSILLGYIW